MIAYGAASAFVAWITWGEHRVLARLTFQDDSDLEFVVANVQGILGGRPVWKAFQHRLLAPWLLATLERVAGDPRTALRVFLTAMLFAQNSVLFALVRRGSASMARCGTAVACLVLARCFFAYKLVYPWDELDILLFLAFGYAVALGRSMAEVTPIVVLATLNHETALWIPLWFLIGAFDGTRATNKNSAALAALALAAVAASVFALRALLYVGPPEMPGQKFEPPMMLIGNPWHLPHNGRQLFLDNWYAGRAFISATFFAAVTMCVALALRKAHRTSALWSLVVLACVACFGYVNETRLYVPLAAFWIARLAAAPPVGSIPVSPETA